MEKFEEVDLAFFRVIDAIPEEVLFLKLLDDVEKYAEASDSDYKQKRKHVLRISLMATLHKISGHSSEELVKGMSEIGKACKLFNSVVKKTN